VMEFPSNCGRKYLSGSIEQIAPETEIPEALV